MAASRSLLSRRLQASGWLLPLLGLLLTAAMSVLLWVTYAAQAGREQEIRQRLVDEVSGSANTVSYFFSERRNDLSIAANHEQVRAYFENVTLGMSDEYGLLISRMAIGDYFSSILTDRRIADKPIYKALALLDMDGRVLAAKPDGDAVVPDIATRHFTEFIGAHQDQGFHVEQASGTIRLILFRKVTLGSGDVGFLFAEIALQRVVALLAHGADVNGWPVILAMGRTVLAASLHDETPITLERLVPSRGGGEDRPELLPAGFLHPGSPETLLCRRAVPGTPFQLISPVAAKKLLGPISPLGVTVILGALCVVVLGSAFTAWRASTRQLVLAARLEEKTASEGTLRLKAQELEILLDSLPGYAFFKDRLGRYIRGNTAFRHMVGATRETLVGRTDQELFPPEVAAAFMADDANILAADKESIEIEEQVTDHGRVLDLLTRKVAIRGDDGGIVGLIGLGYDITDKKRVERELKAARDEMEMRVEERTRQLFEANERLVTEATERRQAHREVNQLLAAVSSVLVGIDKKGRISKWNDAATRAFGLDADQTLGRPFIALPLPWDWKQILESMKQCLLTRLPTKANNLWYERVDGKEGFLFIELSPILDTTGEADGLLLLGTDITDFKLLEDQLAQAQKLESIGQLAAGVAHEINTPTQYVGDTLVFLKQSCEELLAILETILPDPAAGAETPPAPPELQRLRAALEEIDYAFLRTEMPRSFQRVQEGIERVGSIVRAMRNFSHHGGGEKKAIDLNKAVEDTVLVSRNEWKYVATLEMDLDPDLPLVTCLPGEMNQVLVNLVVNAAHAVADAHREDDALGVIRISTRLDGDQALLSVSDTGTGIPVAIQGKIFDPFFTTKEVGRGTGQGLTIVYDMVVNKHGGKISFETAEGRGTTFQVRIPVSG